MKTKRPKKRLNFPGIILRRRKTDGEYEYYLRKRFNLEDGSQKTFERKIGKCSEDLRVLTQRYYETLAMVPSHGRNKPKVKTWGDLCNEWEMDIERKSTLAYSTRQSYLKTHARMTKAFGDRPIEWLTRERLKKYHQGMSHTKREADKLLQQVSMLWNWGTKETSWKVFTKYTNPAALLSHYGVQTPFEPWDENAVADIPQMGWMLRTFCMIQLFTAQRPGAVLEARYSRMNLAKKTIWVVDEKNDKDWEIPMHPEFHRFLSSLRPYPNCDLIINKNGAPVNLGTISKKLQAFRNEYWEDDKFKNHGLRKTALQYMAEAGCTTEEMVSISGQSKAMVDYYVQNANRTILGQNAMKKYGSTPIFGNVEVKKRKVLRV